KCIKIADEAPQDLKYVGPVRQDSLYSMWIMPVANGFVHWSSESDGIAAICGGDIFIFCDSASVALGLRYLARDIFTRITIGPKITTRILVLRDYEKSGILVVGCFRSNIRRAWSKFNQEQLDNSSKPREFKSCLFALCFHALVVGRKRFGPQGWSRAYPFNDGDLTICGSVLNNYLE
ncbi:hypothetical protein FOZ63_022336, partial [Perkinsus olseni]